MRPGDKSTPSQKRLRRKEPGEIDKGWQKTVFEQHGTTKLSSWFSSSGIEGRENYLDSSWNLNQCNPVAHLRGAFPSFYLLRFSSSGVRLDRGKGQAAATETECRLRGDAGRDNCHLGQLRSATTLIGYKNTIAYLGVCNDLERLIRFCGGTRIRPFRGLSTSATKTNAIDMTSGRTTRRLFLTLVLRSP